VLALEYFFLAFVVYYLDIFLDFGMVPFSRLPSVLDSSTPLH